LTPKDELAEDVRALRRFGLAVARDNWLIADDRSAEALVETLSRRAAAAARNGEGFGAASSRSRLFSLFIRFYRRHVRMAMLEEGAGDGAAQGGVRGADARENGPALQQAVRSLPLELRESLLLVTLERFSHVEAAQTLDVSLAALTDRLARGRALLAAALAEPRAVSPSRGALRAAPRHGAAHLRLVK
jgi:DNA-directed RNA polymerase specialized sigma24 family protein